MCGSFQLGKSPKLPFLRSTMFQQMYVFYSKSQVVQIFLYFNAKVERWFHMNIKQLRSNGGTQFKSLEPFFFKWGFLRRISYPYTREQNDVVKSKK